jgi:lysozyme
MFMNRILSLLALSLLLYPFLGCKKQVQRREDFPIQGIDVSHHQRRIDWDKVSKQNMAFAFTKATEGNDFVDSLHCLNMEKIRDAGLIRGSYHFFRPRLSGYTQAYNFLQNAELAVGDLPPVLDIEVQDGVNPDSLRARMSAWLKVVEAHTGVRPIIYSNQDFFERHLTGYFDGYHLWIARYHHEEPELAYGSRWKIWQYGNTGRLDGIKGDVDFNIFSGTIDDLKSLCMAPIPNPLIQNPQSTNPNPKLVMP